MFKDSPSVAVAGGETHKAVGKVVVANECTELTAEVRRVAHGTVPVANNGLRDESGEVVLILPANTLDSKSNVRRRNRVVTESDIGTDELRSLLLLSGNGHGSRARGLAGEVAKVLLSESDQLIVRNTTSSNQDHAVSGVVGLDIVDQVVAGDALDVFLRAKNRAAKRLVLESSRVQVIEDNLLELLVNLLLLTQDHVPLPLDSSGLQLGVLENVGEDIDGLGDIGVEGLGEIDSVFSLDGRD